MVKCDGTGCEAWNLGSSLRRDEVERIRRDGERDLRMGLMALRDRRALPRSHGLSPRESQCLDLLGGG